MSTKRTDSLPRADSLAASKRGELALLGQIRDRAAKGAGSVRLGIGDDCALLRLRPGEEVAVTTDLSIEGRHFRLDWHPPESVGHRALARGLSDLAAMGARPVAAFLSLGLPRTLTQVAGRGRSWPGPSLKPWITRFFDGLMALAEACKVPLAGGDLSESPVALADIVLVGAAPRGTALLRSGARAGDLLYVTGRLGGAAAGLEGLAEVSGAVYEQSGRLKPLRIPRKLETLLAPHLYPQPRIAQGLWLRRRGLDSAARVTSAIDLSDGLSTDLAHLCEESGVGAEVDAELVPICAGASLAQALDGGEDYELLFTAAESARMPRAIGGVPVTRIGRMVRLRKGRPAVSIRTPQGLKALDSMGWEHFS